MRLPRPFFQLPVLFEVARLQAEVAALPANAWTPHPDGVPGNSAARLIDCGLYDPSRKSPDVRRWLAEEAKGKSSANPQIAEAGVVGQVQTMDGPECIPIEVGDRLGEPGFALRGGVSRPSRKA